MSIWTQWLIVFLIACACPISFAAEWWENETKMAEGGKLNLISKDWWKQASQLEEGEQFTLQSKFSDGGWMIIRKEKRDRTSGNMIVWVLDDDKDMNQENPASDQDSDCYVVDYGCDGSVDRIVDYIDTDQDQVPEEMDIRYFVNGELRRSWFGNDLDGDGSMWDIADYEYTGNFFRSDPYGNNEIYMNKYNPNNDTWVPISECPFAFYDTDNDGESEVAVRFSAAPLEFSAQRDPDYANQRNRYEGSYDPAMNRMGVVNIRYSFDIDGGSSKEEPLHYEMGFTMTGSLPYEFPLMHRNQPLRRHPKWTVCIRHEQARKVSEQYVAEHTGFTWREFEDSRLKIGHPSRPEYDRRWEGVFWTWSRRIIHNTGGPIQDWNVRREYMPISCNRRFVYYSPVDRRLHLKGAKEGWLQIGHIGNEEALGEIRMFDTDDDGYFERWEYFTADSSEPYRTAQVNKDENLDFQNDWQEMQSFYTEIILPESIQLNETLIGEFEKINADFSPIPATLSEALTKHISPDEKRYILDLIREYRYRQFRRYIRDLNKKQMEKIPSNDPRSNAELMQQSTQSWDLAVLMTQFEFAYEQGDFKQAIDEIRKIRNTIHEME